MEIYAVSIIIAVAFIVYQHNVINEHEEELDVRHDIMCRVAQGDLEVKYDPEDGGLLIRRKP
jgi:hypothetical protein